MDEIEIARSGVGDRHPLRRTRAPRRHAAECEAHRGDERIADRVRRAAVVHVDRQRPGLDVGHGQVDLAVAVEVPSRARVVVADRGRGYAGVRQPTGAVAKDGCDRTNLCNLDIELAIAVEVGDHGVPAVDAVTSVDPISEGAVPVAEHQPIAPVRTDDEIEFSVAIEISDAGDSAQNREPNGRQERAVPDTGEELSKRSAVERRRAAIEADHVHLAVAVEISEDHRPAARGGIAGARHERAVAIG